MLRFRIICCCFSVAKLCLTLRPHGLQHTTSTISQSLFKFMSIELMMLSNHLTLCHSFFCLQSFPASESFPISRLCIRWPKYWSFSFSIIALDNRLSIPVHINLGQPWQASTEKEEPLLLR